MKSRFLQILARRRALNRNLALRPAALRTDLALNARTMPPRSPFFAQFAGNIHRVDTSIVSSEMARTHVYLKVELDLPESQKDKSGRSASPRKSAA